MAINKSIAELQAKCNENRAEANKLIKAYEEACEKGEAVPDKVKSDMRENNKNFEELTAKLKEAEEAEGIYRTTKQNIEAVTGAASYISPDQSSVQAPQAKRFTTESIAKHMLEDAAFKNWIKQSGGGAGNSPAVELPDSVSLKALITGASDTSGGAFINPDYTGIIDSGTVKKELRLLSMIDVGTTISDTVDFAKLTSFTNNAAPVAEATTTSNGTKPESGAAWAREQVVVENIAHWIPITRRALADAGVLTTFVNDLMRYGLTETLHTQIFSGSGTSPNLRGFSNVVGISTQAYATDVVETMLRARTKVRLQGRAIPTAYGLNPTDYETILLLRDAQDRYLFGGPNAYGINTIWGLPVFEDETFTAGQAWCADWKTIKLWVRENVSMRVSEHHANFFVQNLLCMLFEMRAALGVVRPGAVCSIDLTA